MKKVLLALFTLAFCFSSLFANEAAVKQAILRDAKFASEGRFIECVKYHTKDFVATESGFSTKVTYEDSVIMAKMMDGKHPLEFLFFVFKMQTNRYPNAQEAQRLREQTKNAQILQEYKKLVTAVGTLEKRSQALRMKTMKFKTVQVKGNNAVAVIDYTCLDSNDQSMKKTVRKTEVIKLRKVNGTWMFTSQASKKLSK